MKEEFDRKTELFAGEKKEGCEIVVTLLEKEGNFWIDIRERVTRPSAEGGFVGWTKRGVTMPLDMFVNLNEKVAGAIKNATAPVA